MDDNDELDIKSVGSYSQIFVIRGKGRVFKKYEYKGEEYDSIEEVIKREIENYKKIGCNSIFPIYYGEIMKEDRVVGIVIEECESALHNYIDKDLTRVFVKKGIIFDNNKDRWIYQMCKISEFLNVSGFVHGDISSINICVSFPSHNGLRDLKLIDLGGCRDNKVGNHRWQCKEALIQNKPCEEFDMYSIGVVIWEMCSGELPFKDVSQDKIDAILMSGQELTQLNDCKYNNIICRLLNMKQSANVCEKCTAKGEICEDCSKGAVFGSSPR